MRARFAVAVMLAVAGSWTAVASSGALEPGVFASPSSPAGKEYTAPLSALRGLASGHPTVEGQPGPLFGIGITPAGAIRKAGVASAQGTSRGGASRGGASRVRRLGGLGQARGTAPGAAGVQSTSAGRGPATVFPRVPESGSAVPALLLLAAMVIFGGLGLGALIVIVRRRLG